MDRPLEAWRDWASRGAGLVTTAAVSRRTVVVTGGAGGIGLAIARQFGLLGETVFVNDLSKAAVKTVTDELVAEGIDARPAPADVADQNAVREMVDACVTETGRIDVLVNCAAILGHTVYGDVLEAPEGLWERIIQVNLTGAFYCSREALRHMATRGQGCIVNISSKSGVAAGEKVAAYAASKAGLLGLTRALALDFADRGIRVNAVAPGWIETEQSREWALNIPAAYPKRIPLGRGRAEDVAAAAVFLASDGARYITGTTLLVDGGDLTY